MTPAGSRQDVGQIVSLPKDCFDTPAVADTILDLYCI